MKQRAYLALEDIGVSFPTRNGLFTALRNVDLSIGKGEFVALIGHSGCGKSTLLNIIAGLVKPSRGVVFLDNEVIDAPGPDRAVIFQDHSLLPWLTVEENVRLAVDRTMKKASRAERRDWVLNNLDLVQMAHAAAKRPGELSGGMKQRVGIARALAQRPRVLLLDEPSAFLDARHQVELYDLLSEEVRRGELACVVVMHDLNVASQYASRVALMKDGRIVAAGTIEEVMTYRRLRETFDVELYCGENEVNGTRYFIPMRARRAP